MLTREQRQSSKWECKSCFAILHTTVSIDRDYSAESMDVIGDAWMARSTGLIATASDGYDVCLVLDSHESLL